jgi:regulator of protease activity HflC (stomatin/prohibitin superfamily)
MVSFACASRAATQPDSQFLGGDTSMSSNTQLSNDIEVTSSSPDDRRARKRFGFITAYPHEFLIHYRKGRFSGATSGIGRSIFKWPRDSVCLIPLSLKELVFQANQLSQDNVDVRLRGMAVYRIVDPLKIASQLSFSHRQSAEEKLARMIGDLCRSNAKWLVANLPVEDTLRKRKEEIAEALRKEVSLVVADPEKGWGVEVLTVDIQDVFIQDAEIFESLQARFKTEALREAQLAQLQTTEEIEIRRLQQERALAEHRKESELAKAAIEAELCQAQIGFSKANDEQQFELDRYRVEQNEAIGKYKLEQGLERERLQIELDAEKARQQVEAQRLASDAEIEALRKTVDVENSRSAIGLQGAFIEKALPSLGQVIAQSMENAHLHVYQGIDGGTPMKFAITEIVDVMRQFTESKPMAADSD